jgi:hypothetical protein
MGSDRYVQGKLQTSSVEGQFKTRNFERAMWFLHGFMTNRRGELDMVQNEQNRVSDQIKFEGQCDFRVAWYPRQKAELDEYSNASHSKCQCESADSSPLSASSLAYQYWSLPSQSPHPTDMSNQIKNCNLSANGVHINQQDFIVWNAYASSGHSNPFASTI